MTRFLSASFFKTYAAWLLLPFLGGLFGVLASTANPLVIGLGASSFIGILLLKKPVWNVELVIILGLFFSGLVVLFFGEFAVKMVWGVSILAFMLLVSALYKLMTDPQAAEFTPIFIWIALLFFIYATADSFLQFQSAKETISGFKRYFQVWGLLFGSCWLGFSKQNIDRWSRIVIIICLLQAPFCLYQNLVLVPIRESYAYAHPGLEPIDVVAGTFSADMFGGGNNAEMATTLIMMFAVLLSRYREKIITIKQLSWISLVLLSPLVMGETKIVVILFPLILTVLYRRELFTRPTYAVAALVFGSLFMAITLNVYMIMTKMSLDELVFDTLKYNVYEIGYGNFYLNRTTVLIFWWQHQSLADPLSFLFGHGMGSAQRGYVGHIDMRYPGYGIGLTGASMLLWELGAVGMSLFLLVIVMAWSCANRVIKLAGDVKMRADAAAIQASLSVFFIYPLYRDTLLSEVSFQLVYVLMLGYLAWMYKQCAGLKKL